MGLASYYQKFVKNFASIDTYLTRLTFKEVPFVWSDKCKENSQEIKTLVNIDHILEFLVK